MSIDKLGYTRFHALDVNGNPLAGGKVYTYDTGTTSDQTTYTDNTKGTPNTNPVILDSNGEADIWYENAIKIKIDDINDVQQSVIDNIPISAFKVLVTDGNPTLLDKNGNEILIGASVSSAVNEVTITNAASGNAPTITQTGGGDTGIDMEGVLSHNGVILANQVTSIAALKLIANADDNDIVTVSGYYTPGDGGGGQFYWDASSTATDNGGTVIKVTALSTGRWLRVFDDRISVRWFGAKGDGTTDDALAIDAAWAYSVSTANHFFGKLTDELTYMTVNGPVLYFPNGDYLYSGTGLLTSAGQLSVTLLGESRVATRIQIPSGIWFITGDAFMYGLSISRIHFYGGKGLFRSTLIGSNVGGINNIEDCILSNYSTCAIGHNAPDHPYWKIKDNVFLGSTSLGSIGIALSGIQNQSDITGNQFLRNKYHIKLDESAPDVNIKDNDFIRFTSGGGSPDLTDVWIVPATTTTKWNCRITGNKFGNENLSSNDFRILFADEDTTVTDFLDTHHSTSTSTGAVTGLIIKDNRMSGNSGYVRPMIYSTTLDVRGCDIEFRPDAALPTEMIEFSSTAVPDRNTNANLITLKPVGEGMNKLVPPVSTDAGTSITSDPLSYLQARDEVPQYHTAAPDDVDYVDMMPNNDITTDGGVLNATRSGITDSLGGTNAVELTLTTSTGRIHLDTTLANITSGRLAWLEFDLLKSTSNPITNLYFDLWTSAGIEYRRFVTIPTNWKRVRFPFIPRQEAVGIQLRVFPQGFSSGSAEKIKIGRINMYHAQEPVPHGRIRSGTTQTTVGAAGGATAPPATPTGYTSVMVNNVEYVVPYYAKS